MPSYNPLITSRRVHCACCQTHWRSAPKAPCSPGGLLPQPRVTCLTLTASDRPELTFALWPSPPSSQSSPHDNFFLPSSRVRYLAYSTRPLSSMSSYPISDYRTQRERSRSRSPRRRSSRSPRRSRRSYSPRSRSRSRDDYRRDRRSRSPLSASGAAGSGSPYGGRSGYASGRTFEDRTVAKENMMQSVRESSQQDRRVYVGNLSYDVKWHHLKDFMRQGGLLDQ